MSSPTSNEESQQATQSQSQGPQSPQEKQPSSILKERRFKLSRYVALHYPEFYMQIALLKPACVDTGPVTVVGEQELCCVPSENDID